MVGVCEATHAALINTPDRRMSVVSCLRPGAEWLTQSQRRSWHNIVVVHAQCVYSVQCPQHVVPVDDSGVAVLRVKAAASSRTPFGRPSRPHKSLLLLHYNFKPHVCMSTLYPSALQVDNTPGHAITLSTSHSSQVFQAQTSTVLHATTVDIKAQRCTTCTR